MLLYEGLFVKSNGDLRSMRFIRIDDIPKNILEENTRGKKSTVNRGRLELVWDIDHKTFKYFNHETKVGELTIRTVDTYMEYFEK